MKISEAAVSEKLKREMVDRCATALNTATGIIHIQNEFEDDLLTIRESLWDLRWLLDNME